MNSQRSKSPGLRRFAGEIAIIVIGVLIALGAQQFVQDFSDRQRADDAIAAIRNEVAEHDFSAAEIQIAAPCISAQVDALQKKLVAGDPAPSIRYRDRWNKLGFVIRMPTRVWGDSAWQSIRDADVLRRLEPEFYNRIASHYDQVSDQREGRTSVDDDLNDLSALAVMMPRAESDRFRNIQIAEQVRRRADSLDLTAGQMRDRLARINLTTGEAELTKALSDSGTIQFCREHGYPLGKLRKLNPNSSDM